MMDKEPLTFFDMNLTAQEHQVVVCVEYISMTITLQVIFACDENENSNARMMLQ